MGTFTNPGPAQGAVAITKSDTVNITGGPCRGVYVGGTGDMAVVMADGSTVTFTAVPVGTHPWSLQRVNSTNTSATDMVALF